MRISDKGIRLISHFEGRANFAYNDPVGLCTVGVGHLLQPPRSCTSADFARYGTRSHPKMTNEHVDRVLRRDLAHFEEGVTRLVRKDTKQHEFDAMVSLAFNIGLGGFQGSSVRRLHNARQGFLAGAAFMLWVRGAGNPTPLAGLVRRRKSERYLYRRNRLNYFQ
jgi:lysozyme